MLVILWLLATAGGDVDDISDGVACEDEDEPIKLVSPIRIVDPDLDLLELSLV